MIRRLAWIVLICVVTATAVLWFARRTIAADAIATELAKRGVPARYRVDEIGFGWQRLGAISIGDPARPDLTADWVEVQLRAGWNGVRATAIRAGGVRLRGRVADGKISWGVLDRLLPKTTGGPFRLPEIDVVLDDARLALATPWGAIGAKLDGRGRLDGGFRGKLAAVAPDMRAGACRIARASAYVDLAIVRGAPQLRGPVRTAGVECSAGAITGGSAAVDVTLNPALDAWRGAAALDLVGLAAGPVRGERLTGRVVFSGTARETTGTMALASPLLRAGPARLGGVALDGRFALGQAGATADGLLKVARATAGGDLARQIRALLDGARATPVAPLAAQLATAIEAAGRGAAIDARVAARSTGPSVEIAQIDVRSLSGARLRIGGGEGVRWTAGALRADTRLRLAGGGFPAINGDFVRRGNESRGTLRIAPLVAKDARLVLAPVAFVARDNGYRRASTVATLDGPFSGGRVEGLRAPVAFARYPDGSFVANPGCTPLALSRLAVQSFRLGPTVLSACATGDALLRVAGGRASGGAMIAAPQLRGSLGSTPLDLRAGRARLILGPNQFTVAQLTARLGSGERMSQLDIETIEGRFDRQGFGGTLVGLAGQIGKVPLLIADGTGRWTFARDALDVAGTATVSDDNPAPRFNTLAVDALKLRLADNRIVATGLLREPKSGTLISTVDLVHDLGKGSGRATLDVADLRFTSRLQPESVTRLSLGVVANVAGAVSGRGNIAWTPDGVTSTGRFRTDGLDFAAAFGPVDGARGEIVFTDLLGLVSAPGQVALIDSVNPGVPVLGGRIVYRLAADQRIVVQGGEWPFAGGVLRLQPTVLDMGEAQARRLTFDVDGLDAAKFIQALEFENFAATGLFDGSIPMIFDAQGGRIEGGAIVARAGGGTLAYVGEVSNAELPVYGRLAFDALKSLRYNNLAIGLNGPLDGEMVSTLSFRGVNQNPLTPQRNFLLRQVQRLPFRFNVTVRAPFRELLSTARTFQDPTLILKRIAPPTLPPDIQPAESEKR